MEPQMVFQLQSNDSDLPYDALTTIHIPPFKKLSTMDHGQLVHYGKNYHPEQDYSVVENFKIIMGMRVRDYSLKIILMLLLLITYSILKQKDRK